MADENPIHIRLGYREAFQTKRDILSSQMTSLKIARTIDKYGFYRAQELELKSILSKEIKKLKVYLGRLQKTLPKPKIKGVLEKESSIKGEPSKKTKPVEENLEEQLKEIQRRLDDLQREGIQSNNF